MNKHLERIYHGSPSFVQNALVSAYGLKLYRERYGRISKGFLDELLLSQTYSPDQMRDYQSERFVRLARHAIRTVPFYQAWSSDSGVRPDDIRSIDDLGLFPIMTKDILRSDPDRLLSSEAPAKKHLISLQTSGTTGTPLTIYCTKRDRTHHYAFFSRLRAWFGLPPRSKRATFFGRIIQLPEQHSPPFWRHDLAQRNLLMSSYHLSEANLAHYYEKLVRYRPEEIIGYPSSIYAIAQHILQNRLPMLKPRLIITTAETLLDYQREAIETAFESTIVDQYGCAEMAVFASECEHGTMHVHPEHGIVETVDEDGRSVVGKPGSAVVTGLINMTMPLIRYAIGDRITLAGPDARCDCGRPFQIISEIEGRIDDVLYKRDGTPIGRLSPVFKGNPSIVEAKVIQETSGDLTIKLVTTPLFSDTDRNWLTGEMQRRVGTGLDVNIELVDSIARQPNGKFKAVESRYRPG